MVSFIQAIIQTERISLRTDKLCQQTGLAYKSTWYTDLTTLVQVPEPMREKRKDTHELIFEQETLSYNFIFNYYIVTDV